METTPLFSETDVPEGAGIVVYRVRVTGCPPEAGVDTEIIVDTTPTCPLGSPYPGRPAVPVGAGRVRTDVIVVAGPPATGVDTKIEVETTPIWPFGRVETTPLFSETDVLDGNGAVI